MVALWGAGGDSVYRLKKLSDKGDEDRTGVFIVSSRPTRPEGLSPQPAGLSWPPSSLMGDFPTPPPCQVH